MSNIARPASKCYFCSDDIAEGEPRYTEMLNFRMDLDPIVITPPGGGDKVAIPNIHFVVIPNGRDAHSDCADRRAVLHRSPVDEDPSQIPGQLSII